MIHRTKIRKTYNYLIGGVILLITWGFIYRQLFHKTDLQEIWNIFLSLLNKPGTRENLALALFLVIVNWGIEAGKWRFLIRKIERISFFKSFEAVLTGVSVSTFTPNRVGEYFGRIFILEKAGRIEATLITILGSVSQMMVTILAGSFCLVISIPMFYWYSGVTDGYFYYGLITLVVAVDLMLLFLYFNVAVLSGMKGGFLRKWFRKFRKFLVVFSYYKSSELCHVITQSFLRYVVFTFQYYLLLRVFSVPVPLWHALIIVPVIFFIISIVPSIALTDLGIRGSVAIYFFSRYFDHYNIHDEAVTVGILSSSTLLWLINIAIPALAGSFFMFRLKFFRKSAAA
jgi:hypothetical protein